MSTQALEHVVLRAAPLPPLRAWAARTRYAGAWFQAASALGLHGGLGRPRRLAASVVAAVAQPRRLAALVGLLALTPTEHVSLSASEAGAALRRYLNERFLGVFPQNRLCRGVLVLPPEHKTYLSGRHRQALRTNLRRAKSGGIHCEGLLQREQVMDAVQIIVNQRHKRPDNLRELVTEWRGILARPEMTILVARNSDEEPTALAAVVIDQDMSLIQIAIACDHASRWALHDYIVQTVIERGGRVLCAEGGGPFGALGFEAELHHFQRLLGYELRHLAPESKLRPKGDDRP